MREIRKTKPTTDGADADVEMGGTAAEQKSDDPAKNSEDDDVEYEEDRESDEGAVYPLKQGKIVNMPAFLAFLQHVHNTLSPTLHTPILLVYQPSWRASDIEDVVTFIFEKFKTPALTVADEALVIAWAYGLQSAVVIDVGYEKSEVGVVVEHCVASVGRGIAVPGGGDEMTETLYQVLKDKGVGWTKEMCEQLKRSPLCEILPKDTPLPGSDNSGETTANPAAASAINAPTSTTVVQTVCDDAEEADIDGQKVIDDEGVLDVASIVASGKTQEFLAAQERKKAAAAARKVTRDAKAAAEAAKAAPVKLPNSKKEKAMFYYQEKATFTTNGVEPKAGAGGSDIMELDVSAPATESEKPTDPAAAAETAEDADPAAPATAPKPTELLPSAASDELAAKRDAAREALRKEKKEERKKAREAGADSRRELEVGVERFQAWSDEAMGRLCDAVHHAVTVGVEPSKRAECWDNLVITGNGSRVRGFKERLVEELKARYLISPSSATIFVSELPSQLSTPMGTGAQTPVREAPMPGGGSGVNPLLLAATTSSLNPANNPSYNMAASMSGSVQGASSGGHSSHSQTPTSIKTAKMPEYYPEWKVCLSIPLPLSPPPPSVPPLSRATWRGEEVEESWEYSC